LDRKWTNTTYALNVIAPVKGMWWQWSISIFLSISIAIPIGISQETVRVFSETVDMLNNLFVAFIAMQMGAYALFQALLSDQLIWELYKNGDMLDEANNSFLGVMLLFWFGIMINIVLIIVMKMIPEDMLLFNELWINNVVAIILVIVYLIFHIRVLFEVRNFAINLYRVFVAYNKISILKSLEDKNRNREVYEEEDGE